MKTIIITIYLFAALAFVNAQSAARVNVLQAQYDVVIPVGMLWVNPADVGNPVIHNLPIDSIPLSKKMSRSVSDSLIAVRSLIPTNNNQLTNGSNFITSGGAPVQSVNSKTGVVNLVKADLGLGNVDNTSDLSKPISTATEVALSLKQNSLSGTGFVKISGSTISYDNSTYLTTITSGQVTTALGFTPYNATNPNNYINQAGARSSISLTTIGTGVATYNSSTGSLNVPDYTITVPMRDKSGVLTNTPVFFTDTFTVASATPTISLSTYITAAGKTSCKIVSCDVYRSGATASNIPTIVPTAISSTGATFLLTQTNTATITILGINVLNGLPVVNVPDPQNLKVILSAYFY